MNDLKPCPFCGGEADYTVSSDGYGVECDGKLCFKTIMQEHPTKEYAALAWNTRAERTCNNVSRRLDESRFHCSACEFGCWVKDVGDGRDKLPDYCPKCGARVERNDDDCDR